MMAAVIANTCDIDPMNWGQPSRWLFLVRPRLQPSVRTMFAALWRPNDSWEEPILSLRTRSGIFYE